MRYELCLMPCTFLGVMIMFQLIGRSRKSCGDDGDDDDDDDDASDCGQAKPLVEADDVEREPEDEEELDTVKMRM